MQTVYWEAPYVEGTAGGAMDSIVGGIKASGAELVAHGEDGLHGRAEDESTPCRAERYALPHQRNG